ncbi:DinB family protein [Brevibacillus choshinensis]|uniref:DinB family protein n=1 Tax=Brevibacillus choshinensis TaxID=54911 RepID=UPI002E243239|nr:DinB family protein [Brevibacillus choshinensis]MED4785011.1 DinB family protein [Brevibacillus choshinensis]
MSEFQKTIDDIHRLTDRIIELVQPMSEEELRWKPADDAWSVMEILCHVEEIIPYWLQEIQTIVQSPGSEWGRNHLHEGRLAAVAKANQRTATDIQEGIIGTKLVVESILGNLTPEDLAVEAPSRNPRWGTKPMSFVVNHLVVEHLQSHLGQIQRNMEQYTSANHIR